MINALWITLIGMGLVFIAILLLWGLMALLVRLTSEAAPAGEIPTESAAASAAGADVATTGGAAARAAAAAVAVAMAMAAKKPASPAAANRPDSISVWQAVHRASQISQRESASRMKVLR